MLGINYSDIIDETRSILALPLSIFPAGINEATDIGMLDYETLTQSFMLSLIY